MPVLGRGGSSPPSDTIGSPSSCTSGLGDQSSATRELRRPVRPCPTSVPGDAHASFGVLVPRWRLETPDHGPSAAQGPEMHTPRTTLPHADARPGEGSGVALIVLVLLLLTAVVVLSA